MISLRIESAPFSIVVKNLIMNDSVMARTRSCEIKYSSVNDLVLYIRGSKAYFLVWLREIGDRSPLLKDARGISGH